MPLLIDPINAGANALFEVPAPVPLDGYPIEYGRAIEYEQQTSITITIKSNGLINFMVLFPSNVLLHGSNIYALSRSFLFPIFSPFAGLIQVIAGSLHLYLICTFYSVNMFLCYCFPAKLLILACRTISSWQEFLSN